MDRIDAIFPVSVPLSHLKKIGISFNSYKRLKYYFPITLGSELQIITFSERIYLENVSINPYTPRGKVEF